MLSSRLFALAAVAFGFVAAADTVTVDNVDPAWTFSFGSFTVSDNKASGGSYKHIPINARAEVSFVGSGASVYFVIPTNETGKWSFTFDGQSIGGLDIVNPVSAKQYNIRGLSSHGHPVGKHTIQIVGETAQVGVDRLVYNPGPADATDPED